MSKYSANELEQLLSENHWSTPINANIPGYERVLDIVSNYESEKAWYLIEIQEGEALKILDEIDYEVVPLFSGSVDRSELVKQIANFKRGFLNLFRLDLWSDEWQWIDFSDEYRYEIFIYNTIDEYGYWLEDHEEIW